MPLAEDVFQDVKGKGKSVSSSSQPNYNGLAFGFNNIGGDSVKDKETYLEGFVVAPGTTDRPYSWDVGHIKTYPWNAVDEDIEDPGHDETLIKLLTLKSCEVVAWLESADSSRIDQLLLPAYKDPERTPPLM